jgi:hypothetical protein
MIVTSVLIEESKSYIQTQLLATYPHTFFKLIVRDYPLQNELLLPMTRLSLKFCCGSQHKWDVFPLSASKFCYLRLKRYGSTVFRKKVGWLTSWCACGRVKWFIIIRFSYIAAWRISLGTTRHRRDVCASAKISETYRLLWAMWRHPLDSREFFLHHQFRRRDHMGQD